MTIYSSNKTTYCYSSSMKIIHVQPLEVYKIHIVFENGIKWDINLTPQNDESVFLQLENDSLRKHPQIIANWDVIYRNESLDIDSTACYINITGNNSVACE
jgi:hypothetical protein